MVVLLELLAGLPKLLFGSRGEVGWDPALLSVAALIVWLVKNELPFVCCLSASAAEAATPARSRALSLVVDGGGGCPAWFRTASALASEASLRTLADRMLW